MNHVLACAWYGVAKAADDSENSWLEKYDMGDKGFWFTYTTSFHWSLTQFTGSTDVHPQNVGERVYGILALLFAFMMSAFVVSKVTTSMTRLEIVTARRRENMNQLRAFLVENTVPRKLALRVLHNAQHQLTERARKTPESQIELLGMISESLLVEVHHEMNIIKLNGHPFFHRYDGVSPGLMRQVCHKAVERISLMTGDVLFCQGEVPVHPLLYFALSNKLCYDHNEEQETMLNEGEWACEALLWCHWIHHGTMVATHHTTVLSLDTAKFQQIVTTSTKYSYDVAKDYGRLFVEMLNTYDQEELSDLETQSSAIEFMVEKAFPANRVNSIQSETYTMRRMDFTGLSRRMSMAKRRVTRATARVTTATTRATKRVTTFMR